MFYFKNVPNLEYVSLVEGAKISDYVTIKNLFKKPVLRQDIFENLQFFTKYSIIGNEQPWNVAVKFYDDPTLDWVIFLANNITNVYEEWPLSQESLDNYLLEKYGSYDNINAIHHYEAPEIKNAAGITLVKEGTIIPGNFSIEYYDENLENTVLVADVAIPVTNYEYEMRKENDKREIFILKPNYLNVALSDAEDLSIYKKGGSQYVNETLKRADNIRLFD